MKYFSGKLVFLVYDSRSGSTLFSRELANNFPNIIASPEFRINTLFDLKSKWIEASDSQTISKKLFTSRALDNLELNENEFANSLHRMDRPLTKETVLRCLLGHYASEQHRESAEAFIIKKGTHLSIWKSIISNLSDVCFLHIYRDPRGAINSKLKTPRPYYPRESMAWGGVFLAALRWRIYSRQIRVAEKYVPVLNICYESFLNNPEKELRKVSLFLSSAIDKQAKITYKIPPREQNIHQRVAGGKFDKSRTDAWRTELAPLHRNIIEAVNASEMLSRGYSIESRLNPAKRSLILLAGGIDTMVRIIFHFPYKWWTDLKLRA